MSVENYFSILTMHTSKINVKQRNCSTAKNIRGERMLHLNFNP